MMTKEKKDIEFIDPKIESKELETKKPSFRGLIDGTILTRQAMVKQLPFIIFLSFLAGIYIGNRYHAEKVIRDLTKFQAEVKDYRAQAITSASELMFISKQSEVVKMVKENQLGLEEAVEPPYKIKK
ncbi:MAG TPA: FtsL-like putative cell division protein [Bacteroidales bacterium]